MKTYLCFLGIIAALGLSGGLYPASATDESKEAAVGAVQSWLALVDSGKYPESCDEAAQSLKSQITKDQWVAKLSSIRSPLGKLPVFIYPEAIASLAARSRDKALKIWRSKSGR